MAVKLKELVFDEECLSFYNQNGKLNQSRIDSFNWVIKNSSYNVNKLGYIAAPLWQQAFDWFRVNKGYDLCIMPISMVGFTLYYEIELHHPKDVFDTPPKVKADTYEQSRYACLEKLIELCK